MRGGEEEEEEPKWWNREEEEEEEEEELSSLLPKPEELIPISQTLIPTDLALAFDIDDDPSVFAKRPRLVWTPHLHRRFVDSVSQLGIKNAVPKAIMQLMCVQGLTRENVASHLQKYRHYLKRVGSGLLVGDPALDRLFSSSPVPPLFLHQSGSSPVNAVGTVGELVLRPEGFRGVAENGSGLDRILDRSFQTGQSQQSSSDKCDNLSPFAAVGRVRELKVGTEGFRGVGGNGLVSNLVSDRSFMMGQSQQSSTNGGKFSPFPAVGVVQELGFRGVGRNGLVSNLVSERSFFMGQSQQSSTYRENLSPFTALGPVQELGFRPEGFRGMGANVSGSNAFFDRSLQTGQSQMYGSSPMCVDEMVSGDSGGGRRVLTLFPTREDD